MLGPCDSVTPQLKAPPPTPPGPVFLPMLRQDSQVPDVEPALGLSGSSDACQSLDDSHLDTGEEAIESAGERTDVMGRQPEDVSSPVTWGKHSRRRWASGPQYIIQEGRCGCLVFVGG